MTVQAHYINGKITNSVTGDKSRKSPCECAVATAAASPTNQPLTRRQRKSSVLTREVSCPSFLKPYPNLCKIVKVFIGAARGFTVGYSFKILVAIAFALVKGRLSMRRLQDIIGSKEAITFGRFLGLIVAIYRFSLLPLKALIEQRDEFKNTSRMKREAILKSVAGFVAGLSLSALPKEDRFAVAIYCFTRAAGDLWNFLVKVKVLQELPMGSALGFILSNGPIMFSFWGDHRLMDPTYLRWIKWMGNLPGKSAMSIGGICREDGSPLQSSMLLDPWVPPGSSQSVSAMTYLFRTWRLGLARGLQVYFKVHILASLLRIRKARKNPLGFFAEKTYNLFRSSMFITTYQTIAKSVPLLYRNTFRKSIPLPLLLVSGFLGGSSIFLEHTRRRRELSLYCIPRSLQVIINGYLIYYCQPRYGERSSFITKYATTLNTFFFQLALAMWLFVVHRSDFDGINGLNEGVVRTLFGIENLAVLLPERPTAIAAAAESDKKIKYSE
mmetsp:Transcript_9234/g.22679  ORF Transcript_9234/g.22679 Transcript_9234/m.22679 type:complete len:498 (+) Transcript_9234:141-1634(+)